MNPLKTSLIFSKENNNLPLLRSKLYQLTHNEEMTRLHDGTINNTNPLFISKTPNPTKNKKTKSKSPTGNPDVPTYKQAKQSHGYTNFQTSQ